MSDQDQDRIVGLDQAAFILMVVPAARFSHIVRFGPRRKFRPRSALVSLDGPREAIRAARKQFGEGAPVSAKAFAEMRRQLLAECNRVIGRRNEQDNGVVKTR